MKCSFGCGNPGLFYSAYTKKYRCCKSSNSCPENKKKNSNRLKEVHNEKPIGWNNIPKGFMSGWQNKSRDDIINIHKKASNTLKEKFKTKTIVPHNKGSSLSSETKQKISKARIKNLLDNGKDVSGKGKRGFYDNIYFHSSWELAFYVYHKEVDSLIFKKNTKIVLEYKYNDNIHKFIPDFIHPITNEIYEIKAYLYSKKEEAKYDQYKNKIRFLFGTKLTTHIEYVTIKYGREFTKTLYV